LLINDHHKVHRKSEIRKFPNETFKTFTNKQDIIEEEIKEDNLLFDVGHTNKFEDFNMMHSGDKLKQNMPTMRNLTYEDGATGANNGSP
jgi:hypothetical protein